MTNKPISFAGEGVTSGAVGDAVITITEYVSTFETVYVPRRDTIVGPHLLLTFAYRIQPRMRSLSSGGMLSETEKGQQENSQFLENRLLQTRQVVPHASQAPFPGMVFLSPLSGKCP